MKRNEGSEGVTAHGLEDGMGISEERVLLEGPKLITSDAYHGIQSN